MLLDTHAFLWWCLDDPQLSDGPRAAIAERNTQVLVSAAVGWEIGIKWHAGKLPLPEEPSAYVHSRMKHYGFGDLDISMQHALRVCQLPGHRRDPFDRILIAQAQIEDVPIITADATISQYDVQTLW